MALVLGSFSVIASRAEVQNGLIPFVAIILTEIFAAYCLILAVAIVTESQVWTIFAMVFTNLGFQAVIYSVARIPSIASAMKGERIVWSGSAVALLVGELAAIVVLLGLTFFFQNRKTDFL